MKILTLFAAAAALLIMAVPLESSYGQDPNSKPAGTEENIAVDQANKEVCSPRRASHR